MDAPAPAPSRARLVIGRVLTALAILLVFLALIVPSDLSHLSLATLIRIPIEGLVGVGLLLALPDRGRRVTAWVLGVVLGLLAVVRIIDIAFVSILDRPFDPVIDWAFFGPAVNFLGREIGQAGAIGTLIGVVLLALTVVGLTTFAVRRLARLVVGHRTEAGRTVAVLGVVWVVCAAFGAQLVPALPIASAGVAGLAYDQVRQVNTDVKDRDAFAAELALDPFHNTPSADLLTALRGKDVIVAFVESYGRVAVDDPEMGPAITSLLDQGTQRLNADGFESRSAFLTSSTTTGISWLAHSTLQSGLWVNNQQRYNDLIASNRLTLSLAFHRAGWRTVGVVPANTEDWPESSFYGYDHIYDARSIGYRGPEFSFASIPDQYTLSYFQRSERAAPNHAPVMGEIDLLSSHAPWDPAPNLIDWNAVGDGSVYGVTTGGGDPVDVVFQRDRAAVRADYQRTIEYSVGSLVSYVETYGDDNLVLLLLGDHQPASVIIGDSTNRDVPVTIVAHDKSVLDRISGWGWTAGLKPGSQAPVWRMDAFRDRFFAAFGQPHA